MMTTEAKVGAFTLAGLVLLAAILVHFSGFTLGGDRVIHVHCQFKQAAGLRPSAEVRYVGVNVGSVEYVQPEGLGVVVAVKVSSDARIPKRSSAIITSDGVMGEKYVSLSPQNDADMGDLLHDGDVIVGEDEMGMESLMIGMNKAVIQVQEMLKSMNEMLGDPRVKDSFVESAVNIKDITENIKVLTGSFARMSVSSEDDVRTMVSNFRQMSEKMLSVANHADRMITDFDGDGKTMANLTATVENLKITSDRIQNIVKNMDTALGDPKTAEDIKATINNAKKISEKADNMMGRIQNLKVKTGLETSYSGKAGHWMTNFDANVYADQNSYLKFGWNDIGSGSHFNAQLGKRMGAFGLRAGAIDSKAGVGFDAWAGENFKISLEGYDPNDFRMKLRGQLRVAPDTYVFSQWNDFNKRSDRAVYFGLRREF